MPVRGSFRASTTRSPRASDGVAARLGRRCTRLRRRHRAPRAALQRASAGVAARLDGSSRITRSSTTRSRTSRSQSRSVAFGSGIVPHSRGVRGRFSCTRQSGAVLARVLSQCTAPRAPSPRPSAVSLEWRLVAAPRSAIFGRRRARARSDIFGSGAVSHGRGVGSRFSRTPQWRCCPCVCALNARHLARHRPGPRPSRARRVSSRLPSRPLRSMSRTRSLHILGSGVVSHSSCVRGRFSCIRPWRCCPRAYALNARRLARPRPGPWPSRLRIARFLACHRPGPFLSHPPMAVLPSRVCSQCTAPRAPPLRPSAVSLASRLVADSPSGHLRSTLRARSLRTFGSGVVSHSRGVPGRFSRTHQ